MDAGTAVIAESGIADSEFVVGQAASAAPGTEDLSQEALAERIARHEFWEHRDGYGHPYIRHAERVTSRVPVWAQPAAWLHDVIEACGLTAGQLSAAGVSRPTVEAVVLLSRCERHANGVTYDDYIKAIAGSRNRAGTIARQVKLASLADHVERARELDRPNVDELNDRFARARSVIAAAVSIYGEELVSSPSPPSQKQIAA